MRLVGLGFVLAVSLIACGSDESARMDQTTDGLWLLETLEVDGESVEVGRPFFLEISGSEFGADATCNTFGGEFGGEIDQTLALCLDGASPGAVDVMRIEELMIAAIIAGPRFEGDLVTFSANEIKLSYEFFRDHTPAELFAVLGDASQAADVDEISFDPEGGGPGEYTSLVRLEHPYEDAEFFLAIEGELVCLIVSAPTTSTTACTKPRELALGSFAYELQDSRGSLGIRIALVTDEFMDAAAESDLGELGVNVLVLDAGLEPSEHVFTNASGESFTLTVP